MAGGRIKGITIEIDGDTKGLDSALKGVNSQTAKTSSELRDVNKLLKLDPGNTELVSQKQKLLSKAVESTSAKLDTLKGAQAQVQAQFAKGEIGEEQYRGFQREVQATEAQLGRLKGGLQETTNYLNGSASAAAQAEAGFKKGASGASELENNVSTLTKIQVGEFLKGVADKAAGLGKDVIGTGLEFANAQSKMQSSMGLTAGQAEQAGKVVKTVFSSGLVESVDEAVESVKTVKQAFGDLNNADLKTLTLNLQAIAKHGDVDIKDATNAASQAVKGLGITGKAATDLISKGLQDGLNKNDDFLDTVNEYSPTFKDAGISAGGMLNVLNAGMKAGAFNTDKVADAVKEFQLRLTSGQLDKPMQTFSKSTQGVFSEFKKGKATSAEVMAAVGKDLKSMPANEAKNAVQGLGTQFEDLGTNASAALLQATTGTEKLSGATDKMAKKTPGEEFTGAINKLKASLADLIPKLTPVIGVITAIVDKFASAPGPIQAIIGVIGALAAGVAVLLPVIAVMGTAFSVMAPVLGVIGGAFTGLGAILIGPVGLAIAAVIAAVTAVILVIKNWGTIVDWLKGIWGGISGFFSGLWDGIKQIFSVTVGWIGTFLSSKFGQIVLFVINPFAGMVNFIIQNWNSIKAITSAVVGWMGSFISGAWNGIKAVTSAVWNGIKDVTSTVWNGIKSVISGVWNGIKSVVSSVVSWIKDYIANYWSNVKANTSAIWNGIKAVISGVWNGIKSVTSSVVNAIKSTVSNVWNNIKSVTSSVWNGIKSAMTNPIQTAKGIINGIINTIKGLFNFKLRFPEVSIPHIKLPHFNLSGSFDPLKGKIPSIGINWYAKGGIFKKPTLFAGNGGFNGVGEAGPEAALPLNDKTLGGIGRGIIDALGGDMGGINLTINVNADVTPATIKKIQGAVVDGITRAQNAKTRAIGG